MSVRINRSLQLFTCGHIDSGYPSSLQVSRAGSCPDNASTTSTESCFAKASINSVVSVSISGLRRPIAAPVSSPCTSIRCWRCRGSSWAIMLISSAAGTARYAWSLANTLLRRSTSCRSPWRVTATSALP